MEVDTGKTLPDKIEWVKFSGASWAPDSSGFYYSRYAEPAPGQALKDTNLNQKVYFHQLGQSQSQDTLIYERPDHPKWGFSAGVTDDERFLILSVWEGSSSKNALFYRDLQAGPASPVIELLKDFDAQYDFVGNEGSVFYLLTDRDASRRKLIAVDVTTPDPTQWRTILPEGKSTLQSVSYLNGQFIAQAMVDAHDDVRVP
jgi:prolyl oligopeptidase